MITVLVTGATGFVGSHALQSLAQIDGVRLIAACRDPMRLPEGINVETQVGDLRDQEYVTGLVQDIDVIAHAAAWTSLLNHRKESDAWFLKPSLELIEQAKHAGVSRFIFMSTNSAASPETSSDATSPGIERKYWPHLCNVVKIEDRLREVADKNFCVVNLRLGLFAGKRYNLGLLPILLPRLKTHLVPWVKGGKTDMPIIDGRDIGQSIALASTVKGLDGYESFNVMGPEVPTSRQVIDYLHDRHSYPRPHFGVPFPMAYMFAWLMEKLDTIVPWDPLITRSIIHILEETNSNNEQAKERLGYQPQIHWKEAIDLQVAEMNVRQTSPMHMHVNMN